MGRLIIEYREEGGTTRLERDVTDGTWWHGKPNREQLASALAEASTQALEAVRAEMSES